MIGVGVGSGPYFGGEYTNRHFLASAKLQISEQQVVRRELERSFDEGPVLVRAIFARRTLSIILGYLPKPRYPHRTPHPSVDARYPAWP